MMTPLRSKKPSECGGSMDQEPPSPAKRHQRRWRMAFAAICFTRALVSLTRKVLDNRNMKMLRSLSYVAIDLGNDESPSVGLSSVDQKALAAMVKERSLESLNQIGGVKKVASILESHVKEGIDGGERDLQVRRDVFGANRYKKPPAKGFLRFVLEAFKDLTIIILLVCAIISLGFGIKENGPKDGWYDGGSIVVAISLVVGVSAVSNFKQSRQFRKLSDESNDIKVQVVRDARHQTTSIFDLVVGDVVSLKIGDRVPADGLFLDGHSLTIDESSMTGESDHVEVNSSNNPFLISGTKVTDGFGFMLVTSVGMQTEWGEMMSSITRELDEETPLQARLNKLTSLIGKVGLAVAALVLVVLMIRYFTGTTRDEYGHPEYRGSSKTKANDVVNSVVGIIAAAVTIIVVAIPEGLPLAVTLTLAYSMKRMMKDNAMVRKLSACETMGSATMICTDKTGTLTMNQMNVTEFWLGKETLKVDAPEKLDPAVFQLLQDGIAINTTGSVHQPNFALPPEVSGSPTEKAILSWAVVDLGMRLNETKESCEILQVETFNSEKKRSGVLMRKNNEDGGYHVHWKGAAEMILSMCTHYYMRNGEIKCMNEEERLHFEVIIQGMAAKSLRCIAFAQKIADDRVSEQVEETGFTLLAIVGLKDPCRPGVEAAVGSCRSAGVCVKMVTGDNIHTARAIALECGILSLEEDMEDKAVVEGVVFRNYLPEERMARVDDIRVLARSSPFDKLLMVQCLKEKGHVVAVTGDGTNDAPALKEADIGLSMGIQGTEVAKESSDIVILDDNFASVVTVVRWGRCVFNNIQKFIQFQLTVNVAALFINFAAAVSSGSVPLTAVQLLWVNLIMDTLGALALATEQPTDDLMTEPPVGRTQPLITKVMWRNLTAQALYQVAVLLTLQFAGRSIFGVDEKVKNTIIFNTFVLCQVFNEFNSRNLEKKNVFKGIHKNKLFLAIISITIVLQALMVEILNKFASTERLNWGQWGACIGVAAVSWPIAVLVKCIPISEKASSP